MTSIYRLWGRRLRQQLRLAQAAVRARGVRLRSLSGGPSLRRVLLVSDGYNFTSEQQFAPLIRFASAISRELGLVFEHRPLAEAMRLTPGFLQSYPYIGLKLSWRMTPQNAQAIMRHFAAALSESPTRLLYFDGEDDLCVQWPEVLAGVDAYVKKHVFARTTDYRRDYIGKSNLTDHVARSYDHPFAGDATPLCAALPEADLPKILLGWNIAFDDKIDGLPRVFPSVDHDAKQLDLLTRCFLPAGEWPHRLRNPAIDAVTRLADRFRVLAPRERVSQAAYNQELASARICVSPFGFGELCWRDFEAIMAGCLLVKPDCSHVRTFPHILRPDETYVTVNWDFSNLEERCRPYLEDEPARRRIADRARELLIDACSSESFVRQLRDLWAQLDALGAARRQSTITRRARAA